MKRSALLVFFALFAALIARGTDVRLPQAPEPNPTSITNLTAVKATKGLSAGGPTLYSIGEPTDDEQLYLEFINRARANPPQEGVWISEITDPQVLSAINFFNVNISLMVQEFAAISPAQPLAMNAQITAAARLHSALMFTNMVQSHQITSINEPDLLGRIQNQGYSPSIAAENVFSFSESTLYGHAGFQIDWGNDADGMQTGRGHRVNIHRSDVREIGIGIYNGVNGPVGPQLVTQDFAQTSANTPFLTGVVYHDLNSNEFYDLGEGLGGVQVDVTGANYFAVTAASGGYAVPLPGNGNYTVTFTAANGGVFTTNVTVSGGLNIKVDWRPVYQPPTLTGPNNPVNGFNMNYGFTTPIGITSYSWQVLTLTPLSFMDNADNGLNNFTVITSAGYSVSGPDNVVARSSVFHLTHPELPNPPQNQILELKTTIIPKTGASLSFASRLAFATEDQVPKVQVSQDNGVNWTDVWEQTGGSEINNSTYQIVNIDLGGLPRLETRIRFVYAYVPFNGGYAFGTDYNTGWLFDNISLTGADTGTTVGSDLVTNAAQFPFTITSSGTYLIYMKPSVQNRDYPGSNVLEVKSVTPPTLTISSLQSSPAKKFDVEYSHAASGSLKVLTATSITGPWTEETGAAFETLSAEQNFRVTLPGFSGTRYFQMQLGPQ